MSKVIKGREILKVRKVSSGNKYNVEKDHKFYGQTYSHFTLDGVPFVVNDNDEFVKWRDAGQLFSADFEEGTREVETEEGVKQTVPAIRLLCCTNILQEKAMAQAEADINYILTKYDPEKVDENLLNALKTA